MEEETENSRCNEIETDDFEKKDGRIASRRHGVPSSERTDKTGSTHTGTGRIVGHLQPHGRNRA